MDYRKVLQFLLVAASIFAAGFGCSAGKVTPNVGIEALGPTDGATDVIADTVILKWSRVPQASSYSIYMGTAKDRMQAVGTTRRNNYDCAILKPFTVYYWRVIAEKENGEKAQGPVWKFRTAQKAFPSAEGFGKFTIGGRGGRVIKVTNLNDSGPGSLRAAVTAEGPRIIIFEVSGNIMLKSPLIITEPYVTVAGQSAPGDGITVVGHGTTVATHDVIVRYMRFRATDLAGEEVDALDNNFEGTRFIFDHCTASWGIDETLSATFDSVLTVQWCLVSESLWRSVHRKGAHGYGGIWGGDYSSFHHNLLAHHSSRNPRFDGGGYNGKRLIDYRNNVIYNWGFNTAYGAENDRVNIVNNYYKSGPATEKDCVHRIYEAQDPNARIYLHGNYVYGYEEVTKDNWTGVRYKNTGSATEEDIRVDKPFEVVAVPTSSAEQAYEDVLKKAGAVLPKRDSIDARIINEVKTGTAHYGQKGRGLIDSQFDLCPQKGKCPECSDGDDDYCWLPKLESEPAPKDTDGDGMPDDWEIEHNLDASEPSDGSEDRNNDGYTNVEEYLNQLAGDI